jgi:hypothetical protein
MARSHLIKGSIARATYGALSLLAPAVLFGSVPGMSIEQVDDDARYFNRLFGGRDLLVAIGTLGALRTPEAQRRALLANVFCEATDSVSLVEEVRARGKLDRSTGIGLLFNVFGYMTWFRAAAALIAGRRATADAASDE